MTFTCALAWVALLLTLPIVLLLHFTETRPQRARRWRRAGLTYKQIAQRLHCSPTTARRLALA